MRKQMSTVIVMLSTAFLLSSCIFSSSKQNINKKDEFVTFNEVLSESYESYARLQKKFRNNLSAEFFMSRAEQVRAGGNIGPIRVNRSLDSVDISIADEIKVSERKVIALTSMRDTKERYPIETAQAQFNYDCWLSEVSGLSTKQDIINCKDGFNEVISKLESILIKESKMKSKLHAPDIYPDTNSKYDKLRKAAFKMPKIHSIDFDYDSFKVTEEVSSQVALLIDHLDGLNGDYRVVISGFADRSGSKLYNDSIAFKRARSVEQLLIKAGIPKELVSINSYGEENTQIITKDNKKIQMNRQVKVFVLESIESSNSTTKVQ